MVRDEGRAARPRTAAESARGMINLSFFPSRELALYMTRLFVTRSLAVMIALVLVLMTLDLLGESGKILAVPGNSDADPAIPSLLSAARDTDRLCRPKPAQRGGVDEGGGPFRAPDPCSTDRRKHRRRRAVVR